MLHGTRGAVKGCSGGEEHFGKTRGKKGPCRLLPVLYDLLRLNRQSPRPPTITMTTLELLVWNDRSSENTFYHHKHMIFMLRMCDTDRYCRHGRDLPQAN